MTGIGINDKEQVKKIYEMWQEQYKFLNEPLEDEHFPNYPPMKIGSCDISKLPEKKAITPEKYQEIYKPAGEKIMENVEKEEVKTTMTRGEKREELVQKLRQDPKKFILPDKDLKNTIHIIANNKGGCGKTLVAAMLASFFQMHTPDLDLICFDLDSNKKSFSAYKQFNVQQVSEIMTDKYGAEYEDQTVFDKAFNQILDEQENDAIVIFDTGASSNFSSVISYLRKTDLPGVAAAHEKNWRIIFHTIVSQDSIADTKDTIDRLITNFGTEYVEFVFWCNEYNGDLEETYKELQKEYKEIMYRNVFLPGLHRDEATQKLIKKIRQDNKSVYELLHDKSLSRLETSRLERYFYTGNPGQPGIFETLKNLDWSIDG